MSQLAMLLHDLRMAAIARVKGGAVLSTVDHFSTLRFACNFRPESTEAIFDVSNHTSQARALKAFDTAVGEIGSAAGFGSNTTFTPKHTNLTNKRRPNEDGSGVIKAILLEFQAPKTPTTTTNAGTITDDSDNKQYLCPDPTGFVRRWAAQAIQADYAIYVQKQGGSKEYLGPLQVEATESGMLYALYAFPECWTWGGRGSGAELIVGADLVHKTNNEEWVADTDRPVEDLIEGILGVAGTGSQPAADTLWVNQDVTIRTIGAYGADLRI